MSETLLEVKDLKVRVEDREILHGLSLTVNKGQVHAIMGPNGSGKSTLAYALMGHPAYEITDGKILLDGEDITEMAADERAQRGLFLAFQYPHAIPGVTVTSFLRSAINAVRKAKNGGVDDPVPIPEFRKTLLAEMDRLKVSRELASRYLNDGFSGGEKKRVEILQMAMLKPRIAVLDETDSGLDIDALKVVAEGIETPEVWATLLRLGCDVAQGYYISRPMPAAMVASWTRNQRQQLARPRPPEREARPARRHVVDLDAAVARRVLPEPCRVVLAERRSGDDREAVLGEPGDLVSPQELVVLDADPFPGTADLGVGEAEPGPQAERVGKENKQQGARGEHEQPPEDVPVLQQTLQITPCSSVRRAWRGARRR